MPRIPIYQPQVDLPSSSRIPISGAFDTSDAGAVWRGVGEIGKSISGLGDIAAQIYQRKLQHDAQDKEIALDTRYQAIESEGLGHYTNIQTTEGQERLDNVSKYEAWKDSIGKERNPLDLTVIDENNYYDKKLKKLGINEEDKAKFNLKINSYRSRLDANIAPLIVKAREMVAIQTSQTDVNNARQEMLKGVSTLDEVKKITIESYSKRGLGTEKTKYLISQEIQLNTKIFLEDAFDKDNTVAIKDFLAGKYNAEILAGEGGANLIDSLRDQANAALKSTTIENSYQSTRNLYGDNFETARKAVRNDKTIDSGIQESVISKLNVDESIFKDERERNQTIERRDLQQRLYGKQFKNMESFRLAVIKTKYQDNLTPIINEGEAWFNNPGLQQTNPYDNKHTNMGYFSKMMKKALNGEIKPEDIDPIPFKLGIGHAEIIKKAAEGKFEGSEGDLKREIKNGRARILKGIAGQLGVFDPLSVKGANDFEAALTDRISKAKDNKEMKEMLTPESPNYVGNELVERYTPTMQEMKEEAIKSQKRFKGGKRQEGETIQQFEEKKKKGKAGIKIPDDAVAKKKAIDTLNSWNANPVNKNKKIKIDDENIRKTIEYQQEKGR